MEIVCRQRGLAVVFYSRDVHQGYFSSVSRRSTRTKFLELNFVSAETPDKDIEKWLSYLLSGFEKKFKPTSQGPLLESSASQLHSLALDSIGPG
jgi:hypothetical protein